MKNRHRLALQIMRYFFMLIFLFLIHLNLYVYLFQDPFQSISLPIFGIHGNHDDPSREVIT